MCKADEQIELDNGVRGIRSATRNLWLGSLGILLLCLFVGSAGVAGWILLGLAVGNATLGQWLTYKAIQNRDKELGEWS